MAIRYWKRMRDKAASAEADAESPLAPLQNPWVEPTPDSLLDLESAPAFARPELSADERAAQYTDWANRMREKRAKVRDAIRDGAPVDERINYWSADALYAESRRVEDEELTERPNPWRVRELYATLDLDDTATAQEVGSAYKRLAKQHHPDRFAMADAATQELHAERMRDINRAYESLKDLELA